MPRRLAPGGSLRRLDLAARFARLPSAMERGNAERERLYASARWRRERRVFLKANPTCCTPGCGKPSVVPDHRDVHQH